MGRKAHYKLCTGVSPIGYHLKDGSVSIASQTVVGDHPRSCGHWMDCAAVEPVVDGDVCYTFDIQGHWRGADLSHADEIDALKVSVALSASYVLDSQTFKLRATK